MLPLMAIVAVAIKCDSPGPTLERRRWVAGSGRRLDALNFRTTVHAAGDVELPWRRAAQMTRLGPYLRYTGIDALPQLFNALHGELTLVDSTVYASSLLE
jgi:lipopolysaccharide/colanic/teichoic acid biosynthesis glycosyltransferase